ncbi:MAG: inositol monophosphatase family protein [Pseudomonadota bacterium]
MKPPAIVNVMIRATEKACIGLLRDFGEVGHLQNSPKSVHKFTTHSWKRADRKIASALLEQKPDFGVVSKKLGTFKANDQARFIVDSIDGVDNFMRSIAHFAVLVAVEIEKKIIACVIYDPCKNELFWAHRDHGVFLRQQRSHVSKCQQLKHALFMLDIKNFNITPSEKQPEFDTYFVNFAKKTASIQYLGSRFLGIIWFCVGRYDGCWCRGLDDDDFKIAMFLVYKAGGIARSHLIDNHYEMVAANQTLLKPALDVAVPKLSYKILHMS